MLDAACGLCVSWTSTCPCPLPFVCIPLHSSHRERTPALCHSRSCRRTLPAAMSAAWRPRYAAAGTGFSCIYICSRVSVREASALVGSVESCIHCQSVMPPQMRDGLRCSGMTSSIAPHSALLPLFAKDALCILHFKPPGLVMQAVCVYRLQAYGQGMCLLACISIYSKHRRSRAHLRSNLVHSAPVRHSLPLPIGRNPHLITARPEPPFSPACASHPALATALAAHLARGAEAEAAAAAERSCAFHPRLPLRRQGGPVLPLAQQQDWQQLLPHLVCGRQHPL